MRGQGVPLWQLLKAAGVPVQEGQGHGSAQNCPERFGHTLTTTQRCPVCSQKGQTFYNLIFDQRWNPVLTPGRMDAGRCRRGLAALQHPRGQGMLCHGSRTGLTSGALCPRLEPTPPPLPAEGILPPILVCLELDPNDTGQNLKYRMRNSLSSEFPGFGQSLSQTHCWFKMELWVRVYRLL